MDQKRVRVYRRSASPVQSGPAHGHEWIVEFEPARKPDIDPVMGWISSDDVEQQVRLSFDGLDPALAYCRRQGLEPEVELPAPHRRRPRSYADNFVGFADGTPRPIYPH